jgi:hypothetical protein
MLHAEMAKGDREYALLLANAAASGAGVDQELNIVEQP